ncbi:MAG: GNAT family N-acetyltransferase [Actinomycetota bacterium]|nr:GNAT family N-acetyltransferase [Actinomycetota bacterium]
MPPTLDALAWPVRTDRLVLRLATPADHPAVWRYRRLDEVTEWMSQREGDPETSRARFLEPERLATTLVVETGETVVGDLKCAVADAWSQVEVAEQARGTQAEIGWAFDPEHQGKGYATEAVDALLQIAFDGLGVRRIEANCFADNLPSWRLMERLGMRREIHSVGDSLHRSRGWLDGFTYALLAEEWAASRSHQSGASGRSTWSAPT